MRRIRLALIIGVLLVVLSVGQVSAQALIYSYNGGALNFVEGEGVMGVDGTITSPSRVMYGVSTQPFVVHNAQIEIGFSQVNATGWELFVHDRDANMYRVVDDNRTALAETYRLSGDVVADGLAIAVVSGSATLLNLTVYAEEGTPQDLLDWLIYNMVPPWVIQVGALVCIILFVLLLIAPKKEKTKVSVW